MMTEEEILIAATAKEDLESMAKATITQRGSGLLPSSR